MYLNWIGYFYLRKERNQERKKPRKKERKKWNRKDVKGREANLGEIKNCLSEWGRGNEVNGKNDQSFVVSFNFNSTQEKNNY